MIFEHSDYQSYLKALLQERKQANKAYSLRAMAEALEISASTLSDVMAGKKNFSEETAQDVAVKLKLTGDKKKYFTSLVQFQTTKDEDLKEILNAKLKVLNPKLRNHFDITIDRFNLMAEWYHTAILEMTHLDRKKLTPDTLSVELSISKEQAKAALELLLRLELIEEEGEGFFRKAKGKFQAQSEIPNEALRRYHYQMLSKAQESLRTQTPQEKFVGSETIPLNSKDLPKAVDIIENCFQQLLQLAENSLDRDYVYHVGIQAFKLTGGKK
jgi:uncharacterized protein (TIGR02147 family)